MIIFVHASLEEILVEQRRYAWPRRELCPACGLSRLWGHGFVLAYFDGISEGISLRRYRCPECRCILRLRPMDYFARIQAPIAAVRASLRQRLEQGRWPAGSSRSRQGHWLRSLRRNVLAFLGHAWKSRLVEAFDRLLGLGILPVSRAMESARGTLWKAPYRNVP